MAEKEQEHGMKWTGNFFELSLPRKPSVWLQHFCSQLLAFSEAFIFFQKVSPCKEQEHLLPRSPD